MSLLKAAAVLLCAAGIPMFAQGIRFDKQVTTTATNVPVNAQAPVLAISNATVTVCSTGQNPCSPAITVYSNQALTVQAQNPMKASAQGSFGFWLPSGTYFYTVRDAQGNLIGTFPFSVGGAGAAGAVNSVFGRVGGVVAQTNDYTASQVTNAADLSSTSQQTFLGALKFPAFLLGARLASTLSGDGQSIVVQADNGQIPIPPGHLLSWVTDTAGGGHGAGDSGLDITTVCSSTNGRCTSGGGGTPAGTTGAAQYNNAGSFGGLNGTGLMKLNGASAPTIATAGTDYVIPSGSITGTAGNLSGTPALPNGITATTQAALDATPKLATDAFVTAAVGIAQTTANAAVPQTAISSIGAGLLAHNAGSATIRPGVSTDITTALGFTPAVGAAFQDMQTYLNFSQGSGTIAPDQIGTNNCTLGVGAAAPTWSANSLDFTALTNNCSMPAALNSYKTFYFAVYINPLASGTSPVNGYSPLMSSSTGSGLNVLLSVYANGAFSGAGVTYSPGIFAPAGATAANMYLSGLQIIAYTCGTGAVDHIYVNGVETPSYSARLATGTCGAQTTGNLFLGSSRASPFNLSGFLGSYYGFAASTDSHTAAQVVANTVALQTLLVQKGVSLTPLSVPAASAVFNVAGDSLTCGFLLATPCTPTTPSPTTWPQNLTLLNQPAYIKTVDAITGIPMLAVIGSEPNRLCPISKTLGGVSVASIWLGTNDFASTFFGTPQDVWQRIIGWSNLMKSCGSTQTFVATMISRGGNDSSGTVTLDHDKNVLNALILSQWKQAGFSGVLPFGESTQIGADGTNAGACFQTDHIHLVQACQNLLFPLASNAYNYVFGSTASNPHVVTTLPYTQTATDGAISLEGVTSAGNITGTDCTSPIGVTYTITNPQSAFAITWTPLSGQPVNGLTTAISIPSNGSIVLHSAPNDPSVAGCHWNMDVPGPIARVTTTVGVITLAANSSSSSAITVSMPGVTAGMTFDFTPTADSTGTTGWGNIGGLTIQAWATANTLNYKVINQTAASITTGAAITFNVSAR
jgi:hypothetical protein